MTTIDARTRWDALADMCPSTSDALPIGGGLTAAAVALDAGGSPTACLVPGICCRHRSALPTLSTLSTRSTSSALSSVSTLHVPEELPGSRMTSPT